MRIHVLLVLSALLMACSSRKTVDLSRISEEFVFSSLAFSPVTATSVGYHSHNGVRLDEFLDDYSEAALEKQRGFYRGFRERLNKTVDAERLSPEDRADYRIIEDQISLALLELDTIQNYRHNPTLYVELIGNALYAPHVLQYASLSERYGHIVARLKMVPALLEQARKNLADAPEVWTTVAIEENNGNIGLIEKTLREGAPAGQRDAYDRATAVALPALKSFNEYLKDELLLRQRDWRLEKENYARKFRYTLATDKTPEQVLADAESELRAVRRQMFNLSLPLHHKMYPTHRDPVDLNLIVSETLRKVADRHATPDTYFRDAGRDLQETREFVRRKNLLPLPARDNLQVIETPEFMRGIYAVGGFNPAPALEPQLGAFYWLTPIPKNWPPKRVESKLREYNFFALKLLTIHEAMPGHYVQLEYANDIQPQARRLLRGVFGNGPYVEGWAVYATEVMLDEGYLDNSPELRLTFQKQQLRMIANAILDIRLHTIGMTDQQALDLMLKDTFQETEEATAKLQRAKLSSCQLPTYFVGWRDWWRLRKQYQAQKGPGFQLWEFHKRALDAGALPLPSLAPLLTGQPLVEPATDEQPSR